MNNKFWYFTYNENMNQDLFKKYIKVWEDTKILYIDNYKLCFNSNISNLNYGDVNITPHENNKVYGVAYLLSSDKIDKINILEKYYSFKRYKLELNCKDNLNNNYICIVYITSLQNINNNLHPNIKYLDHISNIKNFIPKNYIDTLINYFKLINGHDIK
jgi:gamma-glutamylcyclotransferase (GGCT)/AIG2-like uncharacterized protein YtfP